ncbi:hypothetical protein A2160_02660 [Candidatus Beckwithbacteria bacterium RBG_13_42_9]|uniref:NAD-dependent epimerase/dehydratase domain-containing protein n=1 Tax=Candidatus Beckwithbacteria bacterium RBG_13_42_9 TaxID=1797457 RepID=A0A1F5E7N8_9BACT|nr:MAG: hypothetical protein A2160_02660 [Candidatus Beckwithbacteria bacterium RBG_13_42_9]
MKIFVTGSEGFVGRNLISQCEKKGIEIIGIDSVASSKPNFYQGDVRSKKIIEVIPQNADAVVHLAALSRDGDCQKRVYDCFDMNVMGTLNLLEAAKKKNVKQFIFASSEWVYGDSKSEELKDENSIIDPRKLTSAYALSKLVSEQNLRQEHERDFCPVTILRFGIIYGPRKANWSAVESLFHAVKSKDTIEVGSLKTARRFIHVTDIGKGIIASLGHKGFEIFNLGGNELITLKDIIETSLNLLGKKPKIVQSNPGETSIRNISNAKIKKALGWQPEISLKIGLKTLL